MIRVPLASLAVLLFCISPAKPQGIQNGGFEDFLTGWTQSVSGYGGVGVIAAGTEGYRCAKMVAAAQSGTSSVTLSQTFFAHYGDTLLFDAEVPTLQNAYPYYCNFSVSTVSPEGWRTNPITISPSDSFISQSCTLPDDAIYSLTFQVFARGGGTEARAEMWIDNVRVTAVPEPGTLLLLVVGVTALCLRSFKGKSW
jgi:hypothetical protein